jgi:hypothetical protein
VRRALAIVLALGGPAWASDLDARMTDLVEALPSVREECGFLHSLCRAAAVSLDRAEGTPPSADLLASRQALLAEARVRDARTAADAIARKRGARPACAADDVCRGVLDR